MGISIWQLVIILVIVLLLFGTKKLRSIGSDLGGAVKGFRSSMDGEKPGDTDPDKVEQQESQVQDQLALLARAKVIEQLVHYQQNAIVGVTLLESGHGGNDRILVVGYLVRWRKRKRRSPLLQCNFQLA